MPTSFPTSLDNFTNPTSSDLMNSATVPHAAQHANLNDAIEAVEARIGVTGSTVAGTLERAGKGIVAYAEKTTNQTGIGSTLVDITGLSVTWTAVANRRYKTTANLRVEPNDAVDAFFDIYLRNAGGTYLSVASAWVLGAKVFTATFSAITTPGAGSQTHKVSVTKSAGTGQQTGSIFPNFIIVEDIGASN